MLHAVKKKVAHVSARKGPPSAEFEEHRQRVEAIKRSLHLLDTTMHETGLQWSKDMQHQRTFAEMFVATYPHEQDETRALANAFLQDTKVASDHFQHEGAAELETFQKMHEKVKALAAEIRSVEALYPQVIQAKSESTRYQNKVHNLEHAKKQNDLKKNRNAGKLEDERTKFETLLQQVTASQKKICELSPGVHMYGFAAWLRAKERRTQIALSSFKSVSSFSSTRCDSFARQMIAAQQAAVTVEGVAGPSGQTPSQQQVPGQFNAGTEYSQSSAASYPPVGPDAVTPNPEPHTQAGYNGALAPEVKESTDTSRYPSTSHSSTVPQISPYAQQYDQQYPQSVAASTPIPVSGLPPPPPPPPPPPALPPHSGPAQVSVYPQSSQGGS